MILGEPKQVLFSTQSIDDAALAGPCSGLSANLNLAMLTRISFPCPPVPPVSSQCARFGAIDDLISLRLSRVFPSLSPSSRANSRRRACSASFATVFDVDLAFLTPDLVCLSAPAG